MTAWIASLGIEFRGALRFDRIGLGQSNLTFAVGDERGGRWVLRRPPLGRLLPSAHDVVREARVLAALEGTDVPVPRVHGVRTDGDVPMVLMEFVDGLVLDRLEVAGAVSPLCRRAIGLAMARTLADVHAVDLGATGLADATGTRPYAERQLQRWFSQWERSKTRELPELDRLTERLMDAVPPQREVALLHGDFHLRNVIASGENGNIAAVLDWELWTLGDPMADLGTLLAYWPEQGEAAVDVLSVTALPGFPRRDDLVRTYLDRTGRDPSALGFWHALALWKLAIIGEGVLRRAMDDPRNRAAAGTPTAAQIAALVAAAEHTAADAGV
ncbi:phosphotransferase family protein [Actinomadura violacea]|uniref:Phosphotransferase family protein n=1 Tax=Actinomadura violacea TaxID=2819934 RepID=A0ABS3RMV7_9ACTN|nr:phosphotransferase family protein [Actinomadura violacea]MBO2458085.1 phosphotransferase family protein [Actinomadura violacea]